MHNACLYEGFQLVSEDSKPENGKSLIIQDIMQMELVAIWIVIGGFFGQFLGDRIKF